MPRRNRVDPWGDLHAVADRGHFTGNRGCVVDDVERVVRHHAGTLWITCTLRYRDHRSPLAAPRRWTPLFFLDDAVALAAGHRPCAQCRREAYRDYRDAVSASVGAPAPLRSTELDARLNAERLRRGRGLDRAADRHHLVGAVRGAARRRGRRRPDRVPPCSSGATGCARSRSPAGVRRRRARPSGRRRCSPRPPRTPPSSSASSRGCRSEEASDRHSLLSRRRRGASIIGRLAAVPVSRR